MNRIRSTRRWTSAVLTVPAVVGMLMLGTAAAQTPAGEGQVPPAAALDEVSEAVAAQLRQALSPGDVVSILRTTGEPLKGRLLRLGDSDLVLRSDAERVAGEEGRHPSFTIPYSTIRALERPRDSSKNGTLIGLGVGIGVWVPFFARAVAIDRNEMDEWAGGYVVAGATFAGIGALVGWAIDAAHSKAHFRFVAGTRPPARVRVEPLVTPGKGASVVVSF